MTRARSESSSTTLVALDPESMPAQIIGEIRNPKSEGRRKSEGRDPKAEKQWAKSQRAPPACHLRGPKGTCAPGVSICSVQSFSDAPSRFPAAPAGARPASGPWHQKLAALQAR